MNKKTIFFIFTFIFLILGNIAESSQQVEYTLKRGISLKIPAHWIAKEEHHPNYKIDGITYDRYYFFALNSKKNGDYAEISVLSKVPPSPTKEEILKMTSSNFKLMDSEVLEAYSQIGCIINNYTPYKHSIFKGYKAFINSVVYLAPNQQIFVMDNIHLSTQTKSILISIKISPPSSFNAWSKDLISILDSIKISD